MKRVRSDFEDIEYLQERIFHLQMENRRLFEEKEQYRRLCVQWQEAAGIASQQLEDLEEELVEYTMQLDARDADLALVTDQRDELARRLQRANFWAWR